MESSLELVPSAVLCDLCVRFLSRRDGCALRRTCRTLWVAIPVHVVESKVGAALLCSKGKLAALRLRRLTGQEVRQSRCLASACVGGHLEVAQWLHERFGLQAEDVRAHDCYAFRLAAEGGDLDTVRWLVDTFHLTAADATAMNAYAVRFARANGHEAVVQYLTELFQLTLPCRTGRPVAAHQQAEILTMSALLASLGVECSEDEDEDESDWSD